MRSVSPSTVPVSPPLRSARPPTAMSPVRAWPSWRRFMVRVAARAPTPALPCQVPVRLELVGEAAGALVEGVLVRDVVLLFDEHPLASTRTVIDRATAATYGNIITLPPARPAYGPPCHRGIGSWSRDEWSRPALRTRAPQAQ